MELFTKGMSFLIENALLIFIIFDVVIIYSMFNLRNQSFFSSDNKPNLLPYEQLKLNVDVETIMKVKTGIFVQGFPTFDLNRNTIKINALIWFKFNRAQLSTETVENFSFLNATHIQKKLIETTVKDNFLILQYAVQVEFFSNLNQAYFPFNDHSIYLVMFHPELTSNQLIYEVGSDSLELADDLQIQDWEIISSEAQVGFDYVSIAEISNNQITHSRVLYTFNIKKTGLRKVLLITAPLILILFLSSSSILYPASGLSVAVGSITGILAYRYVINNMSPNVGYFTLGEYIYNYCLIFICATFLMYLYALYNQIEFSGMAKNCWFYMVNSLMLVYMYYLLFWFKGADQKRQSSASKISYAYPKQTWTISKLRRKISAKPMTWQSHTNTIYSWQEIFAILMDYPKAQKELKYHHHTRVIIFSNLEKDEKTLFECLEELVHQGILNEKLQLTSENIYIVFNQHQLTNLNDLKNILAIECILFQNNPKQVLILQTQDEIKTCLENAITKDITDRFFKHKKTLFVQSFSDAFRDTPPFVYFKTVKDLNLYIGPNIEDIELNLNSSIYMFNLDKQEFFYIDQPILADLPIGRASRWYLQSKTRDEMSFAILELTENAKIHLFQQKVQQGPFIEEIYHALLYFPKPLQRKRIIEVPAIMGLTGALSSQATKVMKGVFLGYQQAYENLDLSFRIQLLDDAYQPENTQKHLMTLLQQQISPLVILSSSGTAPTSVLLPLIKEKKLLLLFPITGAEVFRQPELTHVLHFRASYEKEVLCLLKHALYEKSCKKIAIFYQNDSGGLALFTPAKTFLDSYGIDCIALPYQRNSPNVEMLASEVIKNPPDCIFFFSNAAPSIAMVAQIGAARAANIQLFAASPAAEALSEFVFSMGLDLTFTRVVPYLNDDIEIIHQFKKAYQKQLAYTSFSKDVLEGFIMASIFSDAAKHLSGQFQIEELLEIFHSYHDYNFQGLNLSYNPKTQELFNEIYLDNTNAKKK
jgi:branched-chain amino acid transport system substrate-binding protein